MDTMLQGGDFAVDGRGIPVSCTGLDELVQRALIRLTVRRGSFSHDPRLGSRLYELKSATGDVAARATDIVREALLPMPELDVDRVDADGPDDKGVLTIHIALRWGSRIRELEVCL